MARILCTVPPLVGHLNPALAVARELEERGHEIAWAVHEDRVGHLLPAGARLYSLTREGEVTADDRYVGLRGPESLQHFYGEYLPRLARKSFEGLSAALAAHRPDLLVVDQHMVAGALAARRERLPWVTLTTTSAAILEASPPFESWVQEQFQGVQDEFLPAELHVARPDLSPYGVIVFSIEELVTAGGGRAMIPCTYVGPAGGAARPEIEFPWDWLDPGLPVILATLGTVSRDSEPRFFEVLFEAVEGMALQVVAVAPETLAAKAPRNVLVRPYIPQPELLRQVAGVICHAGHNTVCEALSMGVPLAVAPILGDQPYVARQVVGAGAGVPLRFGKVTVPMMRAAIERLLHDRELRRGAERLAEILRSAPGAAGAADAIEAVIAGVGPRGGTTG